MKCRLFPSNKRLNPTAKWAQKTVLSRGAHISPYLRGYINLTPFMSPAGVSPLVPVVSEERRCELPSGNELTRTLCGASIGGAKELTLSKGQKGSLVSWG